MKVREIITIKGWQDGSGWSYDQCTSDDIIDIGDKIPDSIDWDWWELADNRDERRRQDHRRLLRNRRNPV